MQAITEDKAMELGFMMPRWSAFSTMKNSLP